MSVLSNQRKKRRDSHMKFRALGNNDEFLERITKSLYYAEFPSTERFSLPLSELAVELYSEVKFGKSLERLRLDEASEISRNACISPCSLVLALLYLEQLKTSNPSYVDKVTSSELFVVSLMVASKFLNDGGEEDDVLNSEWATSCGFTTPQINKLEKEFLKAIDWKVFVKEDTFWDKLRSLESRVALNEGKKRGWFSYMELEVLLNQFNAYILAQAVFTVSAVCLVSYAAGLFTVVGSTMLVAQIVNIPKLEKPWAELSVDIRIPPRDDMWNDSHLDIGCTEETLNSLNVNFTDKQEINEVCLMKGYDNGAPSTDNISTFYKHLLIPYNFIKLTEDWKPPSLYLFSE